MPATVMQGFLLDVPDRPGALRDVTARLAREQVNIHGIAGMAGTSPGAPASIGLVTDNSLETRSILRDIGVNVRAVEYLVVNAQHKPGELDGYLTRLADAGLNVVCLLPIIAAEPTLAFAVDDAVKARELLRAL